MPVIKSDIMNRNISNSANFKNLEVPDEEEVGVYQPSPPSQREIDELLMSRGMPPMQNNSDFEQKIKQARKEKITGKERLSEAAKKRINMLCGFEQNLKPVVINDVTYVIRPLKSKEVREALVVASQIDGMDGNIELRNQFVARCLVEIANMDIESFLGEDSLEARLLFVEEIDNNLLEELHGAYQKLTNDIKNKYMIKNEKDFKEVSEDLKK